MGRYSKFEKSLPSQKQNYKIHPIWRGIGCLMLILIPIMSYAGATLLVQANRTQRWLPMPPELAQTIFIPFINRGFPYLLAILIVTVLLSLIGFGVLTFFYSLLYRAVGPGRYGPLDARPIRERPRKRR